MSDKWRKEHPEKAREAVRRWQLKNPEKQREYNRISLARSYSSGARILWKLKERASKRGLPYLLGKEEFMRWFSEQNKVCFYCHRKLTKPTRQLNWANSGLTIDRLDNEQGYTIDNIVLSCHRCNAMKGDWLTAEQMIDAAKRYFID